MKTKKFSVTLINIVIFSVGLVIFFAPIVFTIDKTGFFKKPVKVEIQPNNSYVRTIRVCGFNNYAPFSFYDDEKQPSGFEVELMNAIANNLGFNVKYHLEYWPDVLKYLANHQQDVFMSRPVSTQIEQEFFAVSNPTCFDYVTVFGRKPLKSIFDIYDKKIGFSSFNRHNIIVTHANNIKTYKSSQVMFHDLDEHKIDYLMESKSVGEFIIKTKKYRNLYDVLENDNMETKDLGFAALKEDQPFLNLINTQLEILKADGTIAKLQKKWFIDYYNHHTFREVWVKNRIVYNFFINMILIYLLSIGFIFYYTKNQEKQRQKEEDYMQELKAARNKAEFANAAKTTFLSNMSHDIRTPINAIIGYTNLTQKNIIDNPKASDYLNKISASSSHLLSLINDVLNMSHIESGKTEITEKPENLDNIIENIYEIVCSDISQKNINLVIDSKQVKDRIFICDRLHLTQVLLNILSNAIKYTDRCGSINFIISEPSKDSSNYGNYSFTIRDNGIGMDSDILERLFEPFSRANNTLVEKTNGSGLGMAITKRLVDLMSGTIEVQSKEQEGTEITINFSFKTADKVPDTEAEKEEINLSGLKILLVEDNEFNREIARTILEEEGIIIEEATNGLEAVQKIGDSNPGDYDLVLMDIQMPVLNGYEATREIRHMNNPALANIPIIAMTANAFAEDRDTAFECGMNEHIAKPIEIKKLLETISSIKK